MLGHSRPQGDQENIFKIMTTPLSDEGRVVELFISYYLSRYPRIEHLCAAVGKDSIVKFLILFGGTTIHVVPDSTGAKYEHTLLPEVLSELGEDVLAKFCETFYGKKVLIPPSKVLRTVFRDLDIYEQMSTKKSAQTVARLSKHYQISKHEVWWIYLRVAKALGQDVDVESTTEPPID